MVHIPRVKHGFINIVICVSCYFNCKLKAKPLSPEAKREPTLEVAAVIFNIVPYLIMALPPLIERV